MAALYGEFIAATPGVCDGCDRATRVGERVHYVPGSESEYDRICSDCVD